MLSDISVKRPVFATVLSLLLVALGVMAFNRLPLREVPNIDPPVVSIDTNYRGAPAQVVTTRDRLLVTVRQIRAGRSPRARSRRRQGSGESVHALPAGVPLGAGGGRPGRHRFSRAVQEDGAGDPLTARYFSTSPASW